ncbi:hypothetical protein Rs2_20862 [Raphanus sativus]|nr:hypothetical protein Rs2_20862 [Raphanus sativus]
MNFLADVIVCPGKFMLSDRLLHIVGEDKHVKVDHHEAGSRCSSLLLNHAPNMVSHSNPTRFVGVGARKAPITWLAIVTLGLSTPSNKPYPLDQETLRRPQGDLYHLKYEPSMQCIKETTSSHQRNPHCVKHTSHGI